MALTSQSLFLYGYEITDSNRFLNFKSASLGAELTAMIDPGSYSLTSLLEALEAAMENVDPANNYTLSADRTVGGGLQNRVTIATAGSYLSLLVNSGTNAADGIAETLGFSVASDLTGSTSYTGTSSTGTSFLTNLVGYNYLSPDFTQKGNSSKNVASSGNQETIVYSVWKYWRAQFKYIPAATALSDWIPFFQWATQGGLVEMTPNVSSPTVFYEGWLDKTGFDNQALGYQMIEMLPDFPNVYDTGLLTFRMRND